MNLRRPLAALLAGAALIALVSGAIYLLRDHVPVLGLAVLYLLAVIPVAVVWGLGAGIAVSVASMLVFNFFFLPPVHTFRLQESSHWFALGVFVVTAVVVSELAARSRRRANESALLAEIAASLLERGDSRPSSTGSPPRPRRRCRSSRRRSWSGTSPPRHRACGNRCSRTDGGSARSCSGGRGGAAPPRAGGSSRHWLRCSAWRSTASAWPRGARGRDAATERRGQDRRPARGQPRPAQPADGDPTSASALARNDLDLDRDDQRELVATILDEAERLDRADRQPARPLAARGRGGAARARRLAGRRARRRRRSASSARRAAESRSSFPRSRRPCGSTRSRSSACS